MQKQPSLSLMSITPSTAWMPLDSLAEQWGQFGAGAITVSDLHATSMIFAALARETEARTHHLGAWYASAAVGVIDLEHTLDQLGQARAHWIEAITFLELSLTDGDSETAQDARRLLVSDAMEQRLRICMLLQEVAQEQLSVYRRDLSIFMQKEVS